MKKLALAFMCLVSVAFFASCTKPVENPEPSIAIMTGENFVYDGQTIDINTNYNIGFRAASNSQTKKELASFKLSGVLYDANGNQIQQPSDTTFTISGTEYVFQEVLNFTLDERELVGKVSITATVADVDGKTNSATITLMVNQPAQNLNPVNFDWYRLGSNIQTGLEEYGLYWERNAKSPFANIKPLNGVTLFSFSADKWDATVTDLDKAALFADGAISISVYKNVDVNQNGTYNDVIGTRMADGTLHLLHVTRCEIGAQQTEGRPIHIYGQAK